MKCMWRYLSRRRILRGIEANKIQYYLPNISHMLDIIKTNKAIEAFAVIVDINQFTAIVHLAENNGFPVAQFIRDILSGSINAVQKHEGLVVGFMGDAFLAIMKTADQVMKSCIRIADEIDKVNEYLSSDQEIWPITKKGLKIKIGIEYGQLDISDIHSSFLGTQKLFIGTPVNYASRITSGGNKKNNRCLIGPKALAAGLNAWSPDGPYKLKGKKGEGEYEYYNLDLDNTWCNRPKEPSWR